LKKPYCKISLVLFTLFLFWTLLVLIIDVKEIGPQNSTVGLSNLNAFIHNLFGVNLSLYYITDYLSIIPFLFIIGFAFWGFLQLTKRKSFLKVDFSILMLGAFYITVMAFYVFFEIFVINYRPILIEGNLEASYPSSTTMLTLCVMLTSSLQFKLRIKNKKLQKLICGIIYIFTFFMVISRLISGVHWFSDIIGGILLSFSLITIYLSLIKNKNYLP